MICHLTFNVPVTETGPDAARGGAGAVPRSPFVPVTGTGPDAAALAAPGLGSVPVSALYYVGTEKWVPKLSRPDAPRFMGRAAGPSNKYKE